jgi:hypothetical protein
MILLIDIAVIDLRISLSLLFSIQLHHFVAIVFKDVHRSLHLLELIQITSFVVIPLQNIPRLLVYFTKFNGFIWL